MASGVKWGILVCLPASKSIEKRSVGNKAGFFVCPRKLNQNVPKISTEMLPNFKKVNNCDFFDFFTLI